MALTASGSRLMPKMEKRGEGGCKDSTVQQEDQLIWILPCPSQDSQTPLMSFLLTCLTGAAVNSLLLQNTTA